MLDGRVVAEGTHRDLLTRAAATAPIVTREVDAESEERSDEARCCPSPTASQVPALRASSLFRRHPRALAIALALHVLAAVAGLAAPRLLGELVQAVDTGTTTGHVDKVILVLVGFLLAQTVLTR